MSKKKINKKYAFGGSTNNDPLAGYLNIQRQRQGENPTFIEDPNTALADNNIRKANAMLKAESNPWTQGLDILGGLAMQYGSNMMANGDTTKTLKGGDASTDGFAGFVNKLFGGAKQVKAFGGPVKGMAPVEVEGDEVGELPNGELLDFQGASHENGGIDVVLPGGTDIFSKRISIDGVSMADRKKLREKQLKKLETLNVKNKTDGLIKNSLKRFSKVSEAEDNSDMEIQKVIAGTMQDNFAYGGSTPFGMKPKKPKILDYLSGINVDDTMGLVDSSLLPSTDIDTSTYEFDPTLLQAGKTRNDMSGYYSEEEMDDKGMTDPNPFLKDLFDNVLGELGDAGMPTIGDALGMFGNIKQALDPMKLTLENRAGDTPNVNAFRDFGKDSLKTLQKAKGVAAQNRDDSLQDLNLTRNASLTGNRGSARSVNTQRALDIATDANINKAKRGVFNDFNKQLLNIFGQEAQMESSQDQMVMQGEQGRDLADRQDRGAFYSNLARDKQAVGEVISRTGKNVNEIKKRKTDENLLNSMTEYAEMNIMNGKMSKKDGVKLIGDTNRKLTTFEAHKGWEELGISETDWKKLTKKQKLRKLI